MEPRLLGPRVARAARLSRSSRCRRTGSRTARSRRSTTPPRDDPRLRRLSARALTPCRYPAPGDPALAAARGRSRRAARRRTARGPRPRDVVRPPPDVSRGDVPGRAALARRPRRPPASTSRSGARSRRCATRACSSLASGNLTHDLRDAFSPGATRRPVDAGLGRALRLGRRAGSRSSDDEAWLLRALDTPDGRRAHPTAEHWLPILYAAGAADARDAVTLPDHRLRPRLALDAGGAVRLSPAFTPRRGPRSRPSAARRARAASTSRSSSSRPAAASAPAWAIARPR